MKAVFLSQRVPYPPDRGDRITTWHVLSHILDRGAQVRVGCLSEEARDPNGIDELAARDGIIDICAPRIRRSSRRVTCLAGLFSGRALTLPFFHNRALAIHVAAWLRDDPPDLVYVYSSSMAQYAMSFQSGARIMHFAELDSDKWLQYASNSGWPLSWIYRREARMLLDFERLVARTFDVSLVCSETEKALFMEHIPDIEPAVLPNGVDVDHFRSSGDDERHSHTLIFTGVMDYEPNVQGVLWFVGECWPRLRKAIPDARLLIVGSRPLPNIRALSGRDGIEVTGRVAETPPYFDQAAVAIAPLHMARGIQNKVLEAMSMGLPVVCTRNAAQGLGAGAQEIPVQADTSVEMVKAIHHLLTSPSEARELGRRGAAFVREHCTWNKSYALLDRVLDRALDSVPKGRGGPR